MVATQSLCAFHSCCLSRSSEWSRSSKWYSRFNRASVISKELGGDIAGCWVIISYSLTATWQLRTLHNMNAILQTLPKATNNVKMQGSCISRSGAYSVSSSGSTKNQMYKQKCQKEEQRYRCVRVHLHPKQTTALALTNTTGLESLFPQTHLHDLDGWTSKSSALVETKIKSKSQ